MSAADRLRNLWYTARDAWLYARYSPTLYREETLVPLQSPLTSMTDNAWGSYEVRLARYWHLDLYYWNKVFTALERYRGQHLKTAGLYKYTRSIYNPVQRLVNITAAKCYGGPLDWNELETGAIPLMDADDRIKDGVRQLWKDSNWGQLKMRYARYGARYGDAVLYVADDRDKQRIRLEVLHPGVIREAEFNATGYVQSCVIEYLKDDPEKPGDWVIYRLAIDKERFATYRIKNEKAELYGWHTDINGNPTPQWDNDYGFVPLVISPASDIGQSWGAVTWHGGPIDQIDQLNDLASLTHDQIRKLVDALHYFEGVTSIKQLQSGTPTPANDDPFLHQPEREELRVLIGPADSVPHILAANLDFTGSLKAMENIYADLERNLPELAFAKLREYQLHSNPAVRTALGDAEDRLTEFNGNLDHGLMRAMQIALTMGGIGNYTNYEPFGPDDYERGRLDFRIKPRDVIADTLSFKEQMDLLVQTDAPPRWIWQKLDIDDDEIARAEADRLAQERQTAADVARVLATGITDQEAQDA